MYFYEFHLSKFVDLYESSEIFIAITKKISTLVPQVEIIK